MSAGTVAAGAVPAEVTGLGSAIAYAQQMTDACLAAAGAARQNAAALTGHGVGADVIVAFARAADLTEQAATAWTEAAGALQRQQTVAEAYAVVPEAGSKQFLTETSGPAAPAPAPNTPSSRDKLRMGTKMRLRPGETVTASSKLRDRDGASCLLAAVASPAGARVHVGCGIPDNDHQSWRGSNGGCTVVLDPDGVARLQEGISQVTRDAATTAAALRKLGDETYQLWLERGRLEELRHPDCGEDRVETEDVLRSARKEEKAHRKAIDAAADRLDPAARARYDDLEATRRTTADPHARADLRLRQAGIVYGLTDDEIREFAALDKLGMYRRTREQEHRYSALRWNATPDAGPECSAEMRRREAFWAAMRPHQDSEEEIAGLENELARTEATAVALDPDTDARRRQVIAAHEQAEHRYDSIVGSPVSTAEIPGEWGTIVLQAIAGDAALREPPQYQMTVRPAHADSDWTPETAYEAYQPSPGQLRKLANLLGDALSTAQAAHPAD